MIQGIGARVPLNGPIAANPATTASATPASNHRSWIRLRFTVPSCKTLYERVWPVEAEDATGSTASEVPSTRPEPSLASTAT